jgi:hypothetical protein
VNDLAGWQEANDRFLATALEWLRGRLSPEDNAAGAGAALAAAAAATPPPALVLLARRLGLSRFEQQLLLLCAAPELDPNLAGLCAQANGDLAQAYPTFALGLRILDEPAWDALTPERPLRAWRLIEIHQAAWQPLTASPLRADERIVHFLKGINYLDDRLGTLCTLCEAGPGTTVLPPSQATGTEGVVRALQQAAPGQLPVVQLLGPDAATKQEIISHIAARLGLRLYRLPAELLPAQPADVDQVARLWAREVLLLPLALYVDAQDTAADAAGPLRLFLAATRGIVFLSTREGLPGPGRAALMLDVAGPTLEEQRETWQAALRADGDAWPALLAGQFNLSLPAIRAIGGVVRDEPSESDPREQAWDACRRWTRPRLDTLAQRLQPRGGWDDIVLPALEMGLLRQVASQVRQRGTVYGTWGFGRKTTRGLGISVLFAGESGTGKTLAAEVLAGALRLDLYRIDLSAVVSKYIGETEKNLRRLFDAAEDGGAILFFDEADALFGKRSEVKDSHDRYANIEINYLLQRVEAYRGLAILATNLKGSLDAAFLRRLRFLINFPFPGPSERREIWQRVFPPETPRAELDWDRLVRLNLTGGSIHNVALNAAFLAAEAGTPVTLALLLEAARAEFRKLDRPINEADFRLSVAGESVG